MISWRKARKAHRRGKLLQGPSHKNRDVEKIVGRRDDEVSDPDEPCEKDGFIGSDSDSAEEERRKKREWHS